MLQKYSLLPFIIPSLELFLKLAYPFNIPKPMLDILPKLHSMPIFPEGVCLAAANAKNERSLLLQLDHFHSKMGNAIMTKNDNINIVKVSLLDNHFLKSSKVLDSSPDFSELDSPTISSDRSNFGEVSFLNIQDLKKHLSIEVYLVIRDS